MVGFWYVIKKISNPYIMDDYEEDKKGGYAWEAEYKRSWDVLKGPGEIQNIHAASKRQKRTISSTIDAAIQRGILRNLCIVIDASSNVTNIQMDLDVKLLSNFVSSFFAENPISSIALFKMVDGGTEKIRDFCGICFSLIEGNPIELIADLEKKDLKNTSGDPSLQNALEFCRQSLQ